MERNNDPDWQLPEGWEPPEYDVRKFIATHLLLGCGTIFSVIIVFILCLFLCGCTTTKYVEVEKVRTDTTYITKWQKDSVWLHDSIYVSEKGDTIRIEKWHTKYIEKQLHDTLYSATHDTIPVICEVEKEVPAQLSSWQKLLIKAGYLALAAFIACIIYIIIKIKNKISW
jgi:hypothetical protein